MNVPKSIWLQINPAKDADHREIKHLQLFVLKQLAELHAAPPPVTCSRCHDIIRVGLCNECVKRELAKNQAEYSAAFSELCEKLPSK